MFLTSKASLLSSFSALSLTSSAIAQVVAAETVFGLGQLDQRIPAPFCEFPNGNFVGGQIDGNIVVYTAAGVPLWSILSDDGETIPDFPSAQCPKTGNCEVVFQTDGNFVSYFAGIPLWASGTVGTGVTLTCQENAPYLFIENAVGAVVWSSGGGKVVPPVNPCGRSADVNCIQP